MDNPVNYYANLYHRITIRKIIEFETNRVHFIARVSEMPGCIAEGNSSKEALKALKKAKRDWINDCLFLGIEIPLPKDKIEIIQILPSYFPVSEIKRLGRKEGVVYNFEEEKEAAEKRLKQKKNKLDIPDFEKEN